MEPRREFESRRCGTVRWRHRSWLSPAASIGVYLDAHFALICPDVPQPGERDETFDLGSWEFQGCPEHLQPCDCRKNLAALPASDSGMAVVPVFLPDLPHQGQQAVLGKASSTSTSRTFQAVALHQAADLPGSRPTGFSVQRHVFTQATVLMYTPRLESNRLEGAICEYKMSES